MTDLATVLAQGADQPAATFRALEVLARQTVGARLFTVSMHDPARHVMWRAHSSDPVAYPVTGEKPMHEDRWTAQVVGRGQPFVANSVEAFADVFGDHELIRSLGCESCLNLPVFIAGQFRGTLNLLDGPGHYTPERVEAAKVLLVPAIAAFLLADSLKVRS